MLQDILIAVTDGLKGMSEALAAVDPATTLPTCIVHLIRHSLDFANWKERKPLAAALRPIYGAASAEAAGAALDAFERGSWGRNPTVVASWRRAWTTSFPFLLPPEVRGDQYDDAWRVCTRSCGKSSRRAATFPMTRLPRS